MEHESFIRECHSLAINAGKKGNQPFGAVLVHEGRIILKAENTVETDKDTMRHAEYNLVLQSKQELSQDIIEHSILYTSTAPCLLCTASILTMNIPKIVYSVSNETFGKLVPGVYRYISCEEVVTRLGRNIEVIGPILENEGIQVFQYWGGTFTSLKQILLNTGKEL